MGAKIMNVVLSTRNVTVLNNVECLCCGHAYDYGFVETGKPGMKTTDTHTHSSQKLFI